MLYHVWFGTKHRKWLLLGEVGERIKALIWQIAREKGIDLLECETLVDHAHLLLRTQPTNLPAAVRFLKGVSSRRLFKEFPELKMDTKTSSFWQVRYGVKVVPDGAVQSLLDHIRTQKERVEKFDRPGIRIPQAEAWGMAVR